VLLWAWAGDDRQEDLELKVDCVGERKCLLGHGGLYRCVFSMSTEEAAFVDAARPRLPIESAYARRSGAQT
jgi:hypothetical protein